MTEENNNEDQNKQDPVKPDEESLAEKSAKLDKVIYEKRKTELGEMEGRIDKKMKDYRELIDDAEKQGVTQAGQQVTKVDPVKAKFDEEVNKMVNFS